MLKAAHIIALIGVLMTPVALKAQSPVLVKYCQDLTATYRKAVADGKPIVPRAGQAIADCPTNPNGSIPVLESVLKELGVALPPRS